MFRKKEELQFQTAASSTSIAVAKPATQEELQQQREAELAALQATLEQLESELLEREGRHRSEQQQAEHNLAQRALLESRIEELQASNARRQKVGHLCILSVLCVCVCVCVGVCTLM